MLDERAPRQRNAYRRPSALGVPNSRLNGDTENRLVYNNLSPAEKASVVRPSDNLASEGLDFDEDSEVRGAYQAHDVYRTQKARPNSNLKNDGLDFSEGTSKDDYIQYSGTSRPSRARKPDTLRPEGSIDHSSEAKEAYPAKYAEKTLLNRPGSNLSQRGDINWNTDNNDAYLQHDHVKRPEKVKRGDNLYQEGQFEGDSEARQAYPATYGEKATNNRPGSNLAQDGDIEWRTDKEDFYQKHDGHRPERRGRNEDNLRQEGDFRGDSEARQAYPATYGKKAASNRPGSNLAQDGDIEWRTDKDDFYQKHEGYRPERKGRNEDNLRQEGNFRGDSEARQAYPPTYGQKATSNRPGSNLAQNGEIDWRTDNDDFYQKHEGYRPERRGRNEDNLRQEGDFRGDSEAKQAYPATYGQKASSNRPGSHLAQDGDIDWRTDNDDFYQKHEGYRPERRGRNEDNLRQEGDFMGDSEAKQAYPATYGQKATTNRPGSNLAQDGDIDWKTDNDDFYQKHEGFRPERKGRNEDNLRQEGDFRGDSEAKQAYPATYGQKATNNRPGSNLAQDGDIEWRTDNDDFFQKHEGYRPERRGRNQDNLRQEGGIEGKSEARVAYSAKNGERAQKNRPESNLQKLGGQFEGESEQREFRHHNYKPNRAQRAQDKLTPLEGSFTENSEFKSSYLEQDGSRASNLRPDSKLTREGEMSWKTDKKSAYQGHRGSIPRRETHNDSISLALDELDDTTESQEYRAHRASKPERRKLNDHLVVDGDFEKDTETHNKYTHNEVKGKTVPLRPASRLEVNGDMVFDTAQGEHYRGHQPSSFPERRKAGGNINLVSVKLDDDTEYKTYRRHSEGALRRGPNDIALAQRKGKLALMSGKLTSRTESQAQYKQQLRRSASYEAKALTDSQIDWKSMKDAQYRAMMQKKMDRPIAKDHLGRNDGFIDGTSETKSKYNFKKVSLNRAKKEDTLDRNKETFEATTETKSGYDTRHGRRTGQPATWENQKPIDMLQTNQEKFDRNTETKSKYGKKLQNPGLPKKHRPKEQIQTNKEDNLTDASITKYSYDYKAGFGNKRPEKVRQGTSIAPNGGIEGHSEYSEKFHATRGERSDLQLDNELVTPYGHLAPGEVRRLGQMQNAQ